MAVTAGVYLGDSSADTDARLEDFQSSRLTHSYGPASGALKHDPGYISGHRSEVWTRNFVAEAEFINTLIGA